MNTKESMVIIESTANGFNFFKEMWDDAVAGENDFIPFFAAWYEMEEYRMPYHGERLTEEETEFFLKNMRDSAAQAADFLAERIRRGMITEEIVEDFKNTVLASFPGASFSGAKLVSDDAVYSESGRLMSVTVCGVSVTGTQLRSMFGLRSAAIDLEETDDAVILTTKGYGHGVGMSQYGANVLAQDGWDFSEILLHYYTGAEIVSSDSFSLS